MKNNPTRRFAGIYRSPLTRCTRAIGLLIITVILLSGFRQPYEPTQESLATHPIPEWWDAGKFGIFIHWGPYAVAGYGTKLPSIPLPFVEIPAHIPAEWYWLGQQFPFSPNWFHHLFKYGHETVYDDLLPRFTAENFDADEWIELFEQAGAKYFVLTSKHHDGFALWPSDTTGRDSGEIGAHRDLVGELFAAAERANNRVKPGLYYSIPEFFNPVPKGLDVYGESGMNRFLYGYFRPRNAYTQKYLPYTGQPEIDDYAEDIVRPQLREIINRYRPYLLWCDIGGSEIYFRSNEIIAEYYNDALVNRPEGVLINNRCGDHRTHRDYAVVEQGAGFAHTTDGSERSETARTMGESWGFDNNELKSEGRTAKELIAGLVEAVSLNSNYLLNIGPRADGTIPQWMRDRLLEIGAWLEVNGEAIYGSAPWTQSSDEIGNYFSVGENDNLYILATEISGNQLMVEADIPVTENTSITLLGSTDLAVEFTKQSSQLTIELPSILTNGSQPEELYTQVFRVVQSE